MYTNANGTPPKVKSSEEKEGSKSRPNAVEKFVSSSVTNSTIDAGNFTQPLLGEEDNKTEKNPDRFFSIIFKIFIKLDSQLLSL